MGFNLGFKGLSTVNNVYLYEHARIVKILHPPHDWNIHRLFDPLPLILLADLAQQV